MNINLTKSEIKRLCDDLQIEDYYCGVDNSVRGDFKFHLRHSSFRDNLENNPLSPLYSDFLQKAIEEINKIPNFIDIYQNSFCIWIKHRSNNHYLKSWYFNKVKQNMIISGDFEEVNSIIEAKEQTLMYCLKHMKEKK